VMLVWWPYAQLSPILNPLRAFRRAANFTDFPATVLFDGRLMPANSLPWHYLPTSFLISLPEFYAIALAGGVAALFAAKLDRWSGGDRGPRADCAAKIIFLIFAILFPPVTAIVMGPILYDANRHFLFVIPPLAVLAGVSVAFLMQSRVPGPLKAATALAGVLAAGLTVLDMRQLHPYQYIFYNRTFGGLPAALGRYETDYWGQSHKEGVQWLAANYRPDAPPASIRVANTSVDFQTSYYLERGEAATERFTPVGKREQPHVMLSTTRWNAHLNRPGRVLHVVRRMGVPLLYLVELRPYIPP